MKERYETVGLLGRLVGNHLVRRDLKDLKEMIMGRLDPIDTSLAEFSKQLVTIANQIAALQAGSVTDEEILAKADAIRAAAAQLDALIETPDEDAPPPPPPPPAEPIQ